MQTGGGADTCLRCRQTMLVPNAQVLYTSISIILEHRASVSNRGCFHTSTLNEDFFCVGTIGVIITDGLVFTFIKQLNLERWLL